MIRWRTEFYSLRRMPAFPRVTLIESERQDAPSYRHEGRYRQKERHCLFKYTLSGRGVFRDGAGEHPLPAGTGFLCEIRDPETAYYYPPDGTEPWVFVYATLVGDPAAGMVRELTGRYGPVYAIEPDTEPVA